MKTSDAEWGKALWDWITNTLLPSAGILVEFEVEDLMRLAQKHGRAKKVDYDPAVHGPMDGVEAGEQIWWWGDEP